MNENQWRQLTVNALSGDKKAFEQLYKATEKSVYFTCLKLLANEHNAKDIMQDTFMTALDKLETLEDGAKFPQWVNVIAVNKCKQFFRKTAEDSLDEKLEQGEEFEDEGFIPEDFVSDDAKCRIIMDIIDKELSDVQRQTVILYYYNGLKINEIAGIMDCPVGTVTYRLKAAKEKLREAVLIYEEKHDDRLHAVVPIPILTRILRKEMEKMAVPDIQLWVNTPKNSAAFQTSASTKNTAFAAKAGGKVMLRQYRTTIFVRYCLKHIENKNYCISSFFGSSRRRNRCGGTQQ